MKVYLYLHGLPSDVYPKDERGYRSDGGREDAVTRDRRHPRLGCSCTDSDSDFEQLLTLLW